MLDTEPINPFALFENKEAVITRAQIAQLPIAHFRKRAMLPPDLNDGFHFVVAWRRPEEYDPRCKQLLGGWRWTTGTVPVLVPYFSTAMLDLDLLTRREEASFLYDGQMYHLENGRFRDNPELVHWVEKQIRFKEWRLGQGLPS